MRFLIFVIFSFIMGIVKCQFQYNNNGFQRPINYNPPVVYPGDIPTRQTYQSSERLSDQKCKEYIKAAQETVVSGSLIFGVAPTATRTEKCNFSQGLIIGGENAKAGEFPHMAAIGYSDATRTQLIFGCGGTLISERYVLTAAHCRKSSGFTPVLVRLGDLNLKEREPALPEQDVQIQQFISHENYNPRKYENDIAVIRLVRDVKFSKLLRPACLMTSDADFEGRKPIATGWGLTESASKQTSDILQKVSIDFVSNRQCNEYFEDEGYYIDSVKQLCAGEDGKDSCQGDSGGPLQVTSSLSKCIFKIVGVTSYGSTYCGAINAAGVYTKILPYLDWIEQKVWG